MILRCVRELITVSNKNFTAVDQSFVQNRERLRREYQYAVIFRHVDGLNKFFEYKEDQSAYVIFNVARTGLRLKENVEKVSETQNHCLSKNFVSFET